MEKFTHADLRPITSLFTVLTVPPDTPISRAWLESTLQIVLESDHPLESPFTEGLLFTGASASEVEMQQEARDIIQQRNAWKAFLAQEVPEQDFAQGPHLYYNETVWQILRIHDDTAGSFVTALAPCDQAQPNAKLQTLRLLGAHYQTLGIAVPARRPRTDLWPLRGLRFAVKDAYRLRGLKTSLCNKAYLNISSSSDITATIVQNMVAAGAHVVAMTKLSSMIGKEEPTEAIDYHAPFNPRGDGYQSPAGSSSGSAAAVAAYDWLDFAIGTDTTGSSRRPALVNGFFQMRPTHDAVHLDGIVPVFNPWDAPALFSRDIRMLKSVISTWYKTKLLVSHTASHKPSVIVYPLDYFPMDNKAQMQLIDAFLADLAQALNAVIRRVFIASLWDETRPDEAGQQNVQDYLQDTYVNTNFHDYYYYSTDEFRRTYEERYQKRPYVIPFINWKWELGRPVTKAQRDEGMHRFEVYKKWFLDSVMQQDTSEAYLIMPISNVVVNYRDVPPPPVARPNGFDPLILSPILGAPDIVVPIGEYEYDSRVSGRKEFLPIAVDVVGLPGSDLHLIDVIQHCLEMSARPTTVCTGPRMFNYDT